MTLPRQVQMFMLDNNTKITRTLLGEAKNKRGTKFRLTMNLSNGNWWYTIWVQRIEGGVKGWRYMNTSKDEKQQRRRLENMKVE